MLSVIIIAKDEEANIERCLQSVHFADEIIVLDSGSKDNTVAIARRYTEKVFLTDWPGYGIQKQRALEKAQGDWVLNLDADESVSRELQQEIQEAMASDSYHAYRVAIRMVFYKQPLRYSASPKRHVRLFKPAHARYSQDIVHEKILLPKQMKIGALQQAIKHHSYQDVSHVLYKLNKYSSYSAKIRITSEKSTSLTRIMTGTAWMFFRCFVLQRGFLDGKSGFLFALFSAQGTFYRGLKQIYRDVNIAQLPKVFSEVKEEESR